ncbi:MAG: amidohydrolase family protein [Immundisolibacteraceae bacterium]|nr:amidohydrolase family protein [Immundisolibacteraceae bacterium]
MHDLIIRNARIVDGLGNPEFIGDLAIDGDTIAAVGDLASHQGNKQLDANGLVLTPGFVDPHTHYDAQVAWDRLMTCSPEHGVTTVVIGNCGVGTAPVRDGMRDFLMGDLVNVEGIPLEDMEQGISWNWESFGEYLNELDRGGLGMNIAALVAMTPLRHYVMGSDSLERAGTSEEISQMGELFSEAMDDGAFGFSTTIIGVHVGYEGRPVACRNSSLEEYRVLCQALKKRGRGSIELALKLTGDIGDEERELLSLLVNESERPVTWLAVVNQAEKPDSYLQRLDAVEDLLGWDKAVPQTTCRPLRFQLDLANPYILGVFPTWQPVMRMSREEKIACYRDPAFRQSFRDDLVNIPAFGSNVWGRFYVLDGVSDQARGFAENKRTIGEIALEWDMDPMDCFCEIALEDELRTTFDLIAINYDEQDTIPLVQDKRLMIGLSDGGAHLNMLCDAGYSTHMLERWVRDTGAVSLEEGVRKLTSEPADFFGIKNRGRIEVGCKADLVLLDPDTVACGDKQVVNDLPSGGKRFVTPAAGIHATFVNGTMLYQNGEHVGGLPGRVLRSYDCEPMTA